MRLTEDLVIARAAKLAQGEAVVGIGDDAALVRPPEGLQLLATDMLVEGTHFTRHTHGPADVGWKALAVNVSDVAAMGATPDHCLLSLGLPETLDSSWVDGFFEGLAACSEASGCRLIGGDTVRSPLIVVNVAVTGHVQRPLRRAGAQAGDLIVVIGAVGASAAGLWLLLHPDQNRAVFAHLTQAHRRPVVRLEEGRQLAAFAHAGCDASDGLARSCHLLAQAGSLQAVIQTAALKLPTGLPEVAQMAGVDPLSWVVAGGEDFALVAAIAPQDRDRVLRLGGQVVGYLEPGVPGVCLDTATGRRFLPEDWGYQHFERT